MDGNFLKINDLIRFDFLNPNLIKIKDEFESKTGVFKDFLSNDINQQGNGLKVRIAATHAGLITANHMLYLPDKVKNSVHTFTKDYFKPVLLHHDEKTDPIGRIIDAFYVDTSGLIKDRYKDWGVKDSAGNDLFFNEQLIKDFCDGKMPFSMQVDVVRTLMNKKLKDGKSILKDTDYAGLGHAQIIANITSSDAIQKFLDGRYLTGSVGARTNKAVCSICKQDWIKDDSCDHVPGLIYDDAEMILIAGEFFYDEYSVVNNPADRRSSVLELNYNGKSKNIEIHNNTSGKEKEIRLEFPQYELITEDKVMPDKVVQVQDATQTDGKSTENVLPVESATETKVEPKVEVNVEDNAAPAETEEQFIIRMMDSETVSDEDSDKFYEMFWTEDAAKDMNVPLEILKDAKLSTEKRKKLAKSTFCGPNRSFPVNDCAHYTAALRMISRYKGPGDKSAIRSCVERKGKALGCTSSKDKSKDSMTHARMLHMITSVLEENLYSRMSEEGKENPALSEEEVNALSNVLKRLAVVAGKDNFVKALSSSELEEIIKKFQEISLLDEIISLEENLGKIKDEFKVETESKEALIEEYKLLQQDVDSLRDELIIEKGKLRDSKIQRFNLLMNLKENKIEDRTEQTMKLTDEVLDNELQKLSKDIDMQKITDKLGDGTSRIPEGIVQDPVVSLEDPKKRGLTLIDELAELERNYMEMKFRNSYQAEIYKKATLDRLRKEGKLPIKE